MTKHGQQYHIPGETIQHPNGGYRVVIETVNEHGETVNRIEYDTIHERSDLVSVYVVAKDLEPE